MIDIWLNLTSSQFKKDFKDVIYYWVESWVKHFILTWTDFKNSLESIKLTKKFNKKNFCMTSTIWFHPHIAKEFNLSFLEKMEKLIIDNKTIVAVWETWLDYDRMFSTREEQIFSLKEHFKLAIKLNKPLFLHLRWKDNDENSEKEMMTDFFDIINSFSKEEKEKIKWVVHCFTWSKTMLDEILDFWFYIWITGWVTDEKRWKNLQKIVSKIPLNKLMIETDAPYLTPKNIPKSIFTKRNEPRFLLYVVKKISELTSTSKEEIIENTDRNVEKLFQISKIKE